MRPVRDNFVQEYQTPEENFTMDEGDDFKDVDEGTVQAQSKKKSLQHRIMMSSEKK